MISDSNRYLNWTPADQTANRALDTIYSNLGGYTRMCMVGVQCAALVAAEAMAGYQHVITVDRIVGFPAGVQITANFMMTFVVPAGAPYRVNSFVGAGGAVSINKWIEVDL